MNNGSRIADLLATDSVTLGEYLATNMVPDDQTLATQVIGLLTEDLVIKKLSGTINEFELSLLTLINGDVTTYREAGKLAYLPELVNRIKNKDQEAARFKNSQYLGKVGAKVDLDIILVRKKLFHINGSRNGGIRWVRSPGEISALLICSDIHDNMIKIFHQDLDLPVNQQVHIKAKVKKHDPDPDYGVPSTILNYVKIL